MSSFFFTTPFSNSATSQSGASGSLPARPSDTRISQLRFGFSSSIECMSSSSCKSNSEDNKPGMGRKSCGGLSQYAICCARRVRKQTKEGKTMSTSKAIDQLKGRWIYRSLVNNKVLNTPFANLQFGLGIIEFKKIAGGRILDASLDMGNNLILTIGGEIAKEGGVTSLKWRGTGVAGSPTAGWIYDYEAYLSPKWKKATDKTPILIGSVLRVVAHGGAPAGVTGSCYMVKLAGE